MEGSAHTISTAIALMAMLFFILYIQKRNGGIKALFAKSKAAPQYWSTYFALMAMVILFIYVLAKI